eukprot:TRINITY_DN1552_c1_g1_i2.p1 TRINITY_DN1552_c1_g1~~TRINITY_DN1552_c1_g1_i2.p1  ORF type:complete len:915 (+),score=248.97 TRINITY_DN1552_c1_g1_i2:140-2746(+)
MSVLFYNPQTGKETNTNIPPPSTTNVVNSMNRMNLGPPTAPPRGMMSTGAPPMGPPMGPPTGPPIRGAPMGSQPMAQNIAPPPMGMGMQQPRSVVAPPPTRSMMGSSAMAGGYEQFREPTVQDPDSIEENADSKYMACSLNVIPRTQMKLQVTNVPLVVSFRPFAEGDFEKVPLIGDKYLERCRSCRAYMNPFVEWLDHGRIWKCPFCTISNTIQVKKFVLSSEDNKPGDFNERPELHQGSYEVKATEQYLKNPPACPVYLFLLDVSQYAVHGVRYLETFCDTVRSSLDYIRDGSEKRAKIGFVMYDRVINFAVFKPNKTDVMPSIVSVANIRGDNTFVPAPFNRIIVDMEEFAVAIDEFLSALPLIFEDPDINESGSDAPALSAYNCLGSALRIAHLLVRGNGGKIIVANTCLPNSGDGTLMTRDFTESSSDNELLLNQNSLYKELAQAMNKDHIQVEVFQMKHKYCDNATIGLVAQSTGGRLFSYESFNQVVHGELLCRDLTRILTLPTTWESIVRVRCSHGSITRILGAPFANDLCLVAQMDRDTKLSFEFDLEENLRNVEYVYFQSGAVITTNDGDRRIRVHTLRLPVSDMNAEVMMNINAPVVAGYLAKKAVVTAEASGFRQACWDMDRSCRKIIQACKKICGPDVPTGQDGPLGGVPQNAMLLPLYCLSLMKSPFFRRGIDADIRVIYRFAINRLCISPQSRKLMYPTFFSIFSEIQTKNGQLVIPDQKSPRYNAIQQEEVYILDNGVQIFLYVGHSTSIDVRMDIFGEGMVNTNGEFKSYPVYVPKLTNDTNELIRKYVTILRQDSTVAQPVLIILGGGPFESFFRMQLVEDSFVLQDKPEEWDKSYAEYLHIINGGQSLR